MQYLNKRLWRNFVLHFFPDYVFNVYKMSQDSVEENFLFFN